MTPALVDAYVRRGVADAEHAPRQIGLTQRGHMWLRPGAAPRAFSARQRIAVDRPAFAWEARFRIARVLPLVVLDELVDGRGALELRLLGRTVRRQSGREVSEGEVLRYLAELPWAPHAMLRNPELRWRELAHDRMEVGLRDDPSVAVTFTFGADGDISEASCAARPLQRRGTWERLPWRGVFSSYRELGGVRVPARAEVSWDLPEGRFVYWRGEVETVTALGEPFAREG